MTASPGSRTTRWERLVIDGEDAQRLHAAAAHLPGTQDAVAEEWPAGVASVLPARLLPPLIAHTYAAVNELMEAFALDRATLQAAEPFDPDFFVPGYRCRESLALLCGLPLPGTTSRMP